MAKNTKLARPYARAAFEYAAEHKQFGEWSKFLQKLANAINEPIVLETLRNPKYTPEQLSEICFSIAGKEIKLPQRNFLKVLAQRDRLNLLPEIAQLFGQFLALAEKTQNINVYSAIPLGEEFKAKLVEIMSQRLGKRITLHCETHTNLLGGLIIRIGDKVIDASVRGQLKRLGAELIS